MTRKLLDVHHFGILCDGVCLLHLSLHQFGVGSLGLLALLDSLLDACFSLVDVKEVCVHATHYDTVVDHSSTGVKGLIIS